MHYFLRNHKVLNVPRWQLYFLESITLDPSLYIAVACWVIKRLGRQTDLSQAYKERCRVWQYVELEFHQPKSAEASEIV